MDCENLSLHKKNKEKGKDKENKNNKNNCVVVRNMTPRGFAKHRKQQTIGRQADMITDL